VAAQRLTFERVAAPFGDPAADDRLAADVARGVEGDVGGAMTRYLRARTAFVDRVVVAALEGGVTQVVVAGAGYDGRSLRYGKPGVTWFELDHPSTQADKRRRLGRLGLTAPGTVFVPADFTAGSPAAALAAAGHDPAAPTLFVCEGVAVYLEVGVLASLLAGLRSAAAPGSRLALTLSVAADLPETDGRRRRFEAAVGALGEPVRSMLTADDAAELLAGAGWRAGPAGGRQAGDAHRAGFVVAEPT
jgi:methyltransferase (TIGR00027 family)